MLPAMSIRVAAAAAIATWAVACGGGGGANPSPSPPAREGGDGGAVAPVGVASSSAAPPAPLPTELPAPPPPQDPRYGTTASVHPAPSGAFALLTVDDATEVHPLSPSARACVRAKGTVRVRLVVGDRGGSADVHLAAAEGGDAVATCLLDHVRRELAGRLAAGARVEVVVAAR